MCQTSLPTRPTHFLTTFKKELPNYHRLLANHVHFQLSVPIPCQRNSVAPRRAILASCHKEGAVAEPMVLPLPTSSHGFTEAPRPLEISTYDINHMKVCTASFWWLCWHLHGRRSKARLGARPPARPSVRRAGSTRKAGRVWSWRAGKTPRTARHELSAAAVGVPGSPSPARV